MMAIVSGLTVVLGIGMLIFVHELGHFLVAKKVGIRVEAFSLGFGPRVFGFQHGHTDYKVCAIPLGGYVKMAGESFGDPASGAPDDFSSKTIAQRAWVVSAGVIMNVIFAFVAFPIAFSIGVEFTAPEIGSVPVGGPAWEADVRPGDRIKSIDGTPVISFEDIQPEIAFISRGEVARFELERAGETIFREIKPRYDKARGFNVIDVRNQALPLTFKDDWAGLAALGIDGDDEIESINGTRVIPGDLLSLLRLEENQVADAPVLATVRRRGGTDAGKTVDVRLTPEPGPPDPDVAEWIIGLGAVSTKVAAVVGSGSNGRTVPTVPERLGIRRGDVVKSVDGRPVASANEINNHLRRPRAGGPFELTVERKGDASRTETTILRAAEFTAEDAAELSWCLSWAPVGRDIVVVADSPAAVAGLLTGDTLLSIGDLTVDTGTDLQVAEVTKQVNSMAGAPISVKVRRGEAEMEFAVTPKRLLINRWIYNLDPILPLTVKHREPFPRSMVAGFHQTVNQVKNVLLTLKSLLTGNVASKNVGGIIFIAQASYSFAEQGFARVLFFLAILSLNLAVLNILPIPVLDGGHLVFLCIEKIKGGPVSEKTMGYATWVGLVLLLALMVFATFNDIRRIFGW